MAEWRHLENGPIQLDDEGALVELSDAVPLPAAAADQLPVARRDHRVPRLVAVEEKRQTGHGPRSLQETPRARRTRPDPLAARPDLSAARTRFINRHLKAVPII